MVAGLRATGLVRRNLPGQPGRLRAPAVPLVHGQCRGCVLASDVVGADEPSRPPVLYIRILLLRVHRSAHLCRPRHTGHHAGLPAWADPAAQFRCAAARDADRVRALPAVAPVPLRAVGVAAWYRAWLGSRIRDLGWRPRQDDGLAPDTHPRQLSAQVQDRRNGLEWRDGRDMVRASRLAHGSDRVGPDGGAARGRACQLRRGQPRGISRGRGAMRSKLVPLLAIAIAIAAIAFAIPRLLPRHGLPPVAHASLPPRLASYLGAFAEGAPPAYQP